MNEQPDTAAIRADAIALGHMEWTETVVALCDALDAALAADQDRSRKAHTICCDERIAAEDRAEAAEALVRTYYNNQARAEAAERSVARWVDIAERAEARAEAAEAELAASEHWRHDTAVERDCEVGRRIAAEAKSAEAFQVALLAAYARDKAEARIAELEADITVINDLASGDRAQMRADLKHAETVSSNRLNKVDEMEARIAAALVVLEEHRIPWTDVGYNAWLIRLRRALTEGTGQ